MKARAIAVASDRSNAVGTVELECTPVGLAIVYLGVGSFAEGYAPAAVTSGTQVVVPWAGVHEARLEADQLFLHVDESSTPHNKLLLVNFSDDDAPHPQQIRKQRLILRLGLGGALAVTVLVSALTLPRIAPRAGAIAALALGCAAGLVLLAVGLLADRRIARGGSDSDAVRRAFVADLAMYVPNLGVSLERPEARRPAPLPSFQAMLPRSTTAIAITLTACLLGAVLTWSWILRQEKREQRPVAEAEVEAARTEPRAAATPVATTPAAPPALATTPAPTAPKPPPRPAETGSGAPAAASGDACQCRRSDSVLWRSPFPRLSVVIIERRERPHKDHVHLELELGVVNNGDETIDELSLLVQFYERDPPPSSKRSPTHDRPLYFQGPLIPAQAIKWHVEARGTEFEVFHEIEGEINPGGDNAAPTNRFATLLEANHRPIRLHGAMMLAYFGDPRAKEAALELREALREDEAPYIDRILRTLGDLITCKLEVKGEGSVRTVSACVYNATADPKSELGLRVRALDRKFDHSRPVAPPPIVIAESNYSVAGAIPPKSGRILRVELDTRNPDNLKPAMFEVFADREDLLY